jgi:hypothetical protein
MNKFEILHQNSLYDFINEYEFSLSANAIEKILNHRNKNL